MPPDDERTDPTGADRPASARSDDRGVRFLPVAIAVAVALLMVAGVVVVSDLVAGDRDASDVTPAAQPGSPDSAAAALRDSDASLVPVQCRTLDLGQGRQAAQTFSRDVLDCLDRAWRPVLERMGVTPEPASVDLSDTTRTRCGALPPADEALGLYCDADHTIHLPYSRMVEAVGARHEPAYLATLAHEYGHHIQALTGVFDEAGHAMSERDSADDEVRRRLELQATCFAGMFLDAARETELGHWQEGPAVAVRDFAHWSGVESHGGTRLQQQWASTGFDEGSVGACDTWSASAAEIGGTDGGPASGRSDEDGHANTPASP